ncbi:glyoxalase-like protein [Albidovulum inexpectatum]|uniref:Glyoxalase-like protein n=1 Tax=Albidovulum inexpectatum TaxID=196587 RepID=A0A2S5JFW7_9RHOB|nr:VOC family protein [Albidovulum inexpectatum]PPB80319.1 glyoxalase-like protein [Albidovulum inexpectatum]
MAALDHLVVTARRLEEGVAWLESLLAVPLEPGGHHAAMGTHNRLLRLGNCEYLEVIAIDPHAPAPLQPRWFGLDGRAGPPSLTNWVVRVDDLDGALAVAPKGVGRIMDLSRGDLRWRMAVPESGHLPFDGMFPALIAWQGDAHPAGRLPDRGCRLDRLVIRHPDADKLADAVALDDPRVEFVAGPIGIEAWIQTPFGLRRLG